MTSAADPFATDISAELVALCLAAIAYYLGAFIRHSIKPSSDLPFYKQALMGVPLFLALAVTLLAALKSATQAESGVLAQTLGVLLIFIENGLVVNEAWSNLLQRLINDNKPDAVTPTQE